MDRMYLSVTTATDGSATAYGDRSICGLLMAVQWVDGDLADGVDAVLSCENTPGAKTLLTLTNADDDATYYPRAVAHTAAGVAQTAYDQFIPIDGLLKLAVTNGGSAKSGGCIVYWLE